MPALGLLAAVASVAPWPVRAMNWEVTPRFTANEIFTDNVNLGPAGQENAALVTRLRPGVNITGGGARTRANLSYTLDGFVSVSNSNRNRNRLFHQLNANGNAELLERHLFVDARARRRQFATNLAGPLGVDNTAGFNNLTAVTAVSVSPYLTNHFGSYADSTLRYSHDHVFVDRSGTADSQTNQVSGVLQSGDAFGPFFWSLNASRTRTEGTRGFGTGAGAGIGTGASTGAGRFGSGTFNEASASLGYQLSRHWSVSATGGYQDNDFESIRNSVDGPFWDVGITWVPNQRASLAARYGQRFFGKTGSLDLRYRRRATLWQASYSQRISSLRNFILEDVGTISIFPPDCPPSDPTCVPFEEITLFRPEAVQDFFLLRRGRAAVTLFSARHSATLAYSFLRRTIERDGAESRQQGVTLSWTWRLKANARFIASGGWRQIEPLRVNREDDLWRIRVGLARDLGQLATAKIAYRHQTRLSSTGSAEYDENALIAGISMRF